MTHKSHPDCEACNARVYPSRVKPEKPFNYQYGFCSACGVRKDYANPTCLYPNRHTGGGL